jgi:hypothetical protein
MQDFISDPKNKERICRIKLALTHLEASDVAGEEIEVDSLNGYVDTFYGLGDHLSWGSLGWLHDWYIRPAFKKTKSLLDYSSIRQSNTFKYRRRGSLGKLFKLQLDEYYALFEPPIFSHVESKVEGLHLDLHSIKKEREIFWVPRRNLPFRQRRRGFINTGL